MNWLTFGCLLTSLVLSFLRESEMSCDISTAGVTKTGSDGCGINVQFKISHGCLMSLDTVKVAERSTTYCTIKYTRGSCAQQIGCTCGVSPHRFTVTRHYKVTKSVTLDVSAKLTNGTWISKSTRLVASCKKLDSDNNFTDEQPVETSTGETSTAVGSVRELHIALGVSTSLAVILTVIVSILAVCLRQARMKLRQSCVASVAVRHNPDGGRRDVTDDVSDDSLHAYIDIMDDRQQPEAEGDGYLHPYSSPRPAASGHHYSSLSTSRASPDHHPHPVPPPLTSTHNTAGMEAESHYETA